MMDLRRLSDDALDELLSPFGMHVDVMPDDLFDEDDLDFIAHLPIEEEEQD
jgi:hypothetical protein